MGNPGVICAMVVRWLAGADVVIAGAAGSGKTRNAIAAVLVLLLIHLDSEATAEVKLVFGTTADFTCRRNLQVLMTVQNNKVVDDVARRVFELIELFKERYPRLEKIRFARSPRMGYAHDDMSSNESSEKAWKLTDYFQAFKLYQRQYIPGIIQRTIEQCAKAKEEFRTGQYRAGGEFDTASGQPRDALQFQEQRAKAGDRLSALKRKLGVLKYLETLSDATGLRRRDVIAYALQPDKEQRADTLVERIRLDAHLLLLTSDMVLRRRKTLLSKTIVYVGDEAFRVSPAEDAAIECVRPIRRAWLGSPEQLAPFDPSADSGVDEKKAYALSCAELTFITAKKNETADQMPRVFKLTSTYRFCPSMVELLNPHFMYELAMTVPKDRKGYPDPHWWKLNAAKGLVCLDVEGEAQRTPNGSIVNYEEVRVSVWYAAFILIAIIAEFGESGIPTILIMSAYVGCVEAALEELEILAQLFEKGGWATEQAKHWFTLARSKIRIQSSFTAAGEECDIAIVMHGRSSVGKLSATLGFLTRRQLTTAATRGTGCVTIVGDITFLVVASEKGEFDKLAGVRIKCESRNTLFSPSGNHDIVRLTLEGMSVDGRQRWDDAFLNMLTAKPPVEESDTESHSSDDDGEDEDADTDEDEDSNENEDTDDKGIEDEGIDNEEEDADADSEQNE